MLKYSLKFKKNSVVFQITFGVLQTIR